MAIITSYFAHHDSSGKIIGLFNTAKHNSIPEPRISISKIQRDAIVSRPSDFSVHIKGRTLIDSGESKSLQDNHEDFERVASEKHNKLIAAGVEVGGKYYYADDVASAHLTQCLVLSLAANDNSKYKVKVSNSGKPKFVEVDKKLLTKIVKAVNNIRVIAKQVLIEG